MSSSRDDFGIAIRSALLQRGAKQKFSLFFFIILSGFIFFLEIQKITLITLFRGIVNDGVYRVSSLATSPFKITSNIGTQLKSFFLAQRENKNLKKELEKLKLKELNVEYLFNQNKNLRKILADDKEIFNKNILAKVILDKDSPYLKSIIINKGSKSGVIKGLPVLDGNYLIGKIVESNFYSSRVLLLNDLNSRVPVTLDKNATQAILIGKGLERPTLEYLPEFYTDTKSTVFTSGKDGVFGSGIPIGISENDKGFFKVKLFSDPNQLSFVKVQIKNIKKEEF